MKQQRLEKQLADIKKLCELPAKHWPSTDHLADAILETYEDEDKETT
jgi:hypothetical protein